MDVIRELSIICARIFLPGVPGVTSNHVMHTRIQVVVATLKQVLAPEVIIQIIMRLNNECNRIKNP
jgi:hypothetical protein